MRELSLKLAGVCRYYGTTDNAPALWRLLFRVKRLLCKWLNRRSQRKSFGWDKFKLFLAKHPLPSPKVSLTSTIFGLVLLILYVNDDVRSRVRQLRKHGSVRGAGSIPAERPAST